MSRKKTREEWIELFVAAHGEGRYNYDPMVYVNNKVDIQVICVPCDHQFSINVNKHKNGQGCDLCAEKARDAARRNSGHTTASWIKDAIALHKDRYDYSKAVYKGYDQPIKIICSEHGEQELPKAYMHIAKGRMQGCPICSKTVSKGAAAVARALKELGVDYIEEWRDHDCRDIKKLRFDFYLPKYTTVIEYDGDQHFKPGSWGKDEVENKYNLITGKRRDAIKSIWCKENNISLMRITSEVDVEDMVGYIDYMLELYSDRVKVDIRFVPEDAEYLKEVGMDQYLRELKQWGEIVRDIRKKTAH
jgi:hypothetical protein